MRRDLDAEAQRAESTIDERHRRDAVHGRSDRGGDLELGRVRLGSAARDDYLAARDRQRVHHRLRSRFPEPVAHLVVERLELADLVDVRVIPEAIQELWPVRLEVDRLPPVALEGEPLLRAAEHGMEIAASQTFPGTREP